jgi:hypothetical protein
VKFTTGLTKNGFAIQHVRAGAKPGATTTYMAPSTVKIDTAVGEDGTTQTLELYASPSRPGFCNHVGRMVIVKGSNGKMPALLKRFTYPRQRLNHVLAAFLNQDGRFSIIKSVRWQRRESIHHPFIVMLNPNITPRLCCQLEWTREF